MGGRLIRKINIPIVGDIYVGSKSIGEKTTMALQDTFKKLYEYEEAEEKGELKWTNT